MTMHSFLVLIGGILVDGSSYPRSIVSDDVTSARNCPGTGFNDSVLRKSSKLTLSWGLQ